MAGYSLPAQPAKRTLTVNQFAGVDLRNSPTNVSTSRSPAAPNMIRDQIGKVRKRMGYATVHDFGGGKVNGFHRMGEDRLYHVGTTLYRKNGEDEYTVVAEDMADHVSRSFVFGGYLYLLDGSRYRRWDGETLQAVSESAYVPTIVISRNPSGGGQDYEALNLLGRAWKESFLGTEEATEYQLTTEELDEDPVLVEVMTEEGDWKELTEGTDFTVDREKGTVTFSKAPGKTPLTGADNVVITACKTREGYAAKVDQCTVFALYGVGGAADRVFFSGNSEAPGMDWYSAFADPTFIPDNSYTQLSRDGSAVVGYAVINNTLATMLGGSEPGRNAVVRTGSLDTNGEALFRVSNTLMGEPAVGPGTFTYVGKEPMFATAQGIFSITAEELTGEKYAQERSYYIGEQLQALDLSDAQAVNYRGFYALAAGERIYLLDSLQKSYEKNNPYSSYQMEAYYWTGIHAVALWVDGEALWFGTEDGKIKRFHTNVDDPGNYNDDGEAIDAYWETADFDGSVFFKNKSFTGIAVRLASAPLTGVKVYAQKRGIWSLVFDSKDRARYFDWGYIDFAKFVFSADRTPRTLFGKVKLKKVDKVRFRLQNKELNEPFGIYAFGLEYREPGSNYKR